MENTPQIDSKIIQEHGLSIEEYDKIINILGIESKYVNNTILFYIYDDGTVEKRIAIE